jgi:sugar phosphate isomerase/epimerase
MYETEIHLGGTARSPDDVVILNESGLQFAEIPIINPEQFLHRIGDYEALREELSLYYLCHGPREGDPNNVDTLENIYLPKLIQILSIMPQLEMRVLTIHLRLDPRFVAPELIAYKVGFLKRVLQRAGDSDITVCLENLSENAEQMAPIFEALPSLNLTLDLGHGQLLSDQNTSFGFMDKFPDRIRHIHAHDNLGVDSSDDDLHLPVGKGVVDFEGILRRLNQIGYDETITLELKPAEIKENLDRLKQLLNASGFGTNDKC